MVIHQEFDRRDPSSSQQEALEGRLRDLRNGIVRLASLVTDAIIVGTEVVITPDQERATRLVDDDDSVDALRHTIEDDCVRLLGHPGLGPAELRLVGTAMRTAHELERSADLMVNVAHASHRLYPHAFDDTAVRIIERLGRQLVVQLRVAVNAFADLDPTWAAALADMDETVDELNAGLMRHALACGSYDDEAALLRAVQLALVARHYERIGDHAVKIAEQVEFIVTGDRPMRRTIHHTRNER